MIDPRISMSVQQASVAPAINTFMQMREQQRRLKFDPLQMQQMQLSNQAQQTHNTANEQAVKQQQTQNKMVLSSQLWQQTADLFESGDIPALTQTIQNSPLPEDGKAEALQMIQNGQVEPLKRVLQGADKWVQNQRQASAPAGILERDRLLQDLNSDDPNVVKSAQIKLGLKPRAVGSATQTITETGTAQEIAETEKVISTGKREGTLTADLNLRPEVEKKVKEQVLKAQADANAKKAEIDNERTYSTYVSAMDGVAESLTGTTTGYFSGLLPAVSTNQQIAEGAVKAMAPVLKQLFRGAGEGTFTDKDQEMLMGMLPTRRDNPEAVAAKIEMVDKIVKSKLGIQQESPQPQPEQVPTTNPNAQRDSFNLEQSSAPQSQPVQTIGRFQIEVID
jgi:hypothetical protein